MDAVAKLQALSLVNKVCAELDNHLGVSDKTLAEFIIDLAQQHSDSVPAFRAALDENGAEFPASFAASLHALVQKMTPKKKAAPSAASSSTTAAPAQPGEFPGLAASNDSAERRRRLEEEALGGRAVANPEIAALPQRGGGKSSDMMPPPPPGRGGGGSGGAGASGGPPLPDDRPPDDTPLPGRVYPGKVSNVLDFGCFVQLDNVRGRAEGLVHVSLIGGPAGGKAHDQVKRGQKCYVKVLSATGTKLTLSMKDADQRNGADLTPNMRLPGQPSGGGGSSASGGGGGGGGSSSNGGAGGSSSSGDADGDEPKPNRTLGLIGVLVRPCV